MVNSYFRETLAAINAEAAKAQGGSGARPTSGTQQRTALDQARMRAAFQHRVTDVIEKQGGMAVARSFLNSTGTDVFSLLSHAGVATSIGEVHDDDDVAVNTRFEDSGLIGGSCQTPAMMLMLRLQQQQEIRAAKEAEEDARLEEEHRQQLAAEVKKSSSTKAPPAPLESSEDPNEALQRLSSSGVFSACVEAVRSGINVSAVSSVPPGWTAPPVDDEEEPTAVAVKVGTRSVFHRDSEVTMTPSMELMRRSLDKKEAEAAAREARLSVTRSAISTTADTGEQSITSWEAEHAILVRAGSITRTLDAVKSGTDVFAGMRTDEESVGTGSAVRSSFRGSMRGSRSSFS
mmetsp:Transcript_37218/g.89488  ORF Transcript_37218/g.89488 Transcript_37218/m.89488 type:complete len:347 (+) Transcript_37218:105-1145(+)